MDTTWAAPRRTTPLDAPVVELPGSKSLTNRVLLLSAIADGPSVVSRGLRSRDTDLMVGALRALGTRIEGADDLTITPPVWGRQSGRADVDTGLAGTVMRFVPPVAALSGSRVAFDGDQRARERPMRTVVAALRSLGVQIEDEGRGTLPFDVVGSGAVRGGVVTIDASSSSQFVSALLLAGARYEHGVDVRHVGKPVPSMPHIDMSVTQLRLRGVQVDDSEPNRWVVAPGPVSSLDVVVETDLSNAGAFIGAALVTGGSARIAGWPAVTDQAGDRWREIASLFGAEVTTAGDTLEVIARPVPAGIQLDLHDEGELTPVVAAVCALADSSSHLTGIGHLRGHETDRLAAIATEINAMGGDVTELDDGLAITPRPLHGATFHTYADHRMAHAGAVLGLAVDDTEVVDVETTAKTFPGFAQAWERFVS